MGAGDVGVVTIEGTSAPVPNGCSYGPRGYVCPAVSGAGRATVRHAGSDIPAGAALFEIADAGFGPADRGRYLDLAGDTQGNTGVFPIIKVVSPTALQVLKGPGQDVTDFSATYRTLAGAGPAPGTPHEMPGDPLLDTDRVTVGIQAAGSMSFRFPSTVPIAVGGSFSPRQRVGLQPSLRFPSMARLSRGAAGARAALARPR